MKRKIFFSIILILIIICISNVVFAEKEREKWDDFMLRFEMESQKEDGGNLTEDDLNRMIKGPTEEDMADGSIRYDAASGLAELQEKARNLLETRGQGGTGIDYEKWKDAKDEAEELYNKMQNSIQKGKNEDAKNYAKKLQDKIGEMRTYDSAGTLQDSLVTSWDTDASLLLKDEGEEPKNNYKNQVNNKGENSTPGEKNDKIYKQPNIITGSGKVDGTLDDMISDADSFVSKGDQSNAIELDGLKNLSGRIYDILLEIGVGAAVLIGIILGIKFLLSGVEEKAEVNKMLWVYTVGCIVTFGAFGIWKLVVTILQKI